MKNRYITIGQMIKVCFIILAVIFFFFPIIWIVLTSFKTHVQIFSYPPVIFFRPRLNNFIIAFMERPLLRGLINSLISSMSVVLFSAVLGVSAGYALSRFHIKGKIFLTLSILIARSIPAVTMTLPLYLLMQKIGLRDNIFAVIIAHSSFAVPFAIWLQWGFVDQIPFELEEAACIDGLSRLGSFIKIIVPLCVPGLLSTSILVFLESWNEFLFSLVLTNRNAKTLPIEMVSFITPVGEGWGQMFATSVIIIIPSIIFIFFISRRLTESLTMGAVKG